MSSTVVMRKVGLCITEFAFRSLVKYSIRTKAANIQVPPKTLSDPEYLEFPESLA